MLGDPPDGIAIRGHASRGRLELIAVGLVGVVAILWAHLSVPWIATGDGYAAYFPMVWDLEDGKGTRALDSLSYGFFRMPGYSFTLYFGSMVAGHVGRAVTVVALCSVLATFGAVLRASSALQGWAPAFAAALFLGSNCFLNMAFVSTPDLVCLAIQAWALALIVPRGRTQYWLIAGGLAGLAALFRINAIWLIFYLGLACWLYAPAAGRRRAMARLCIGAAVPLLGWSALSFVSRGVLFWIPGSSTELPINVFHPTVLTGSNDLWSALIDEPLRMARRIAVRCFLTGPLEVSRHAAGAHVTLLALLALPRFFSGASRLKLGSAGALVLLSWLPMALSGFEPRYFPTQVGVLCWAAGNSLDWLRCKLVGVWSHHRLAASVALALVLFARWPALDSHLAGQRGGAKFVSATIPLEEAAASFEAGCIGTEETAYRMSAFRYLMRLHQRDRLCCCGLAEGQAGFLRFNGYGTVSDDALRGFRRVEPAGASPMLELFERIEPR